MRFAQIGNQRERAFDRRLRHLDPRRRGIEPIPIKIVIGDGPPAVGQREIRVAPDRFVQEPNGLEESFLPVFGVVESVDQFLRLKIEIEGGDVPR